MRIKSLFIILSVVILTACSGNPEYAYNERVAANFFDIKRQYEKVYESMLKGNMIDQSPQNLKENTARVLGNMNSLEVSDAAKEFHSKANEYFTLISGEASDLFINYQNLDRPEKKDSIIHVAAQIYNKSIDISNEMLAEQLKYMEKVGLKPAEDLKAE
ncbi:MAG: hypothetical protein LBU84_06560 [Prevotella sp.]|jgi:hypothetical protein|nr:hypothetical protein [Prevotella sp.]